MTPPAGSRSCRSWTGTPPGACSTAAGATTSASSPTTASGRGINNVGADGLALFLRQQLDALPGVGTNPVEPGAGGNRCLPGNGVGRPELRGARPELSAAAAGTPVAEPRWVPVDRPSAAPRHPGRRRRRLQPHDRRPARPAAAGRRQPPRGVPPSAACGSLNVTVAGACAARLRRRATRAAPPAPRRTPPTSTTWPGQVVPNAVTVQHRHPRPRLPLHQPCRPTSSSTSTATTTPTSRGQRDGRPRRRRAGPRRRHPARAPTSLDPGKVKLDGQHVAAGEPGRPGRRPGRHHRRGARTSRPPSRRARASSRCYPASGGGCVNRPTARLERQLHSRGRPCPTTWRSACPATARSACTPWPARHIVLDRGGHLRRRWHEPAVVATPPGSVDRARVGPSFPAALERHQGTAVQPIVPVDRQHRRRRRRAPRRVPMLPSSTSPR